jgi:segregation and condensation protein B
MAVVAYRQPISRSRISAIRGVNVDGVVRTLVTRGLIEEGGVDAESGAILYRTTSYFLERMGLGDIGELPDIAQHLPEMEDMEDEVLAGADDVLGALANQDPIAEDPSPSTPDEQDDDRG